MVPKIGTRSGRGGSEQDLAVAAQQAYRHIFHPSRDRLEGADVDLTHAVVDFQNASANPGDGQRQVARARPM